MNPFILIRDIEPKPQRIFKQGKKAPQKNNHFVLIPWSFLQYFFGISISIPQLQRYQHLSSTEYLF